MKKKKGVSKKSVNKTLIKTKSSKRIDSKKVNSDGIKVPLKWIFLTIIIAIVLSLTVSYMVVSLAGPRVPDYSTDSGKIIVQVVPDSSQGKIIVEVVDESGEKEVSE